MGTVTEFSAGIPAGAAINDLVVGPDGNLWFTLVPGIGRSGRRVSSPECDRPDHAGRGT